MTKDVRHIATTAQKKGAAELLILAQLEVEPTHGYQIARLITERSGGVVSFTVTSLYPILYSLEDRGLIIGKWVEKAGQRRRRYYHLTAQGKRALSDQREIWSDFMRAIQQASGLGYA
jgi:transcriptional regulator